jgi:putative CocE/NonD family hydrolase
MIEPQHLIVVRMRHLMQDHKRLLPVPSQEVAQIPDLDPASLVRIVPVPAQPFPAGMVSHSRSLRIIVFDPKRYPRQLPNRRLRQDRMDTRQIRIRQRFRTHVDRVPLRLRQAKIGSRVMHEPQHRQASEQQNRTRLHKSIIVSSKAFLHGHANMTVFMRLLAFLALAAVALAQDHEDKAKKQLEYTRSHYTKFDFRIPMRDGVKLFTSVYVPKDTTQTYPILMQRTPYSVAPYGVDNYRNFVGPSELASKEGFIVVYQDVRGRYLSEGDFIDVPIHKTPAGPKDTDESTDTYDTIDWLIKHVPNNNGRVGIWGISYPGFYAAFSLIDAHPALKAVSPQAPMGDVGNGDDAYHNGVFFLANNFGFYASFKPRKGEPARPEHGNRLDFGTHDEYDFYLRLGPLANANEKYFKNENSYWDDLLKHPNYDAFWQTRALAPHMKNATPATLFVGGWFDGEDLSGPLKLFRAAPKSSLVMGPWPHGGWSRLDGDRLGNLDFGSKTGEFYREHIELPFFIEHLKNKAPKEPMPKAWLFETGRNEWVRFAKWPPAEAAERSLYLDAGGRLTFDVPKATAFDEYTSDPDRPVPVIGTIGEGMPSNYMTYDQRFAAVRPDVLVYQTAPLDHDITIAGPIQPLLRVATTGTDSDFVVKLIDVYPNDYPDPSPNPTGVHMGGYQHLVRGEPFRGKFRNSFEKPEPFTPGQPAKIEFVMPDVCHVFRPGHRIMVQIQSSWFPLTDRNPQKFVNIPDAKTADFQKAVERVYRGGADGSRLKVHVIE